MFLGGVYHDNERIDKTNSSAQLSGYVGLGMQIKEVSFFKATWGYIVIIAMCVIERICLSWMKDRFGCDEEACEIIKQFEQEIQNYDKKIMKIQKDIDNAETIEKKAKMKAR